MAAGDPTGDDLAVGTTDGDTLPTYASSEEREVTFDSSYALVSGTQYAIVVRATGADATFALFWGGFRPGAYSGGENFKSVNSGSTWISPSSDVFVEDQWFTTKAGGVAKDSYTGTPTVWYSFGQTVWWAQTFTAASSYSISSVILKLSKASGKSPGTITVSIKAVEGATPTKATNPTPSNGNTDVTLDQATLTWEDGGGATSYNVYYGTESGNLSLVSEGQTETALTVTGITDGSPYPYITTRYWRIDSINDDGTTTGDEWSFTTIRFKCITVTFWYAAGGYYYRLLVDADGNYGSHPPTGVEDTDYEVLSGYAPNPIRTVRKLVAVAKNSFYYEET